MIVDRVTNRRAAQYYNNSDNVSSEGRLPIRTAAPPSTPYNACARVFRRRQLH